MIDGENGPVDEQPEVILSGEDREKESRHVSGREVLINKGGVQQRVQSDLHERDQEAGGNMHQQARGPTRAIERETTCEIERQGSEGGPDIEIVERLDQ